jgi:DNA-binding NarL/FixJ family response regulator
VKASLANKAERRRQVLESIACGLDNKEIANQLQLTKRMVTFSICQLFEFLNVKSRRRAELVAIAFRTGLLK